MKRIGDIFLKIFAWGILLCLFAGGMSLAAYIVGIVIGGDMAANLCAWIYNVYLPAVIKFTSLFTGIGLVGMYFSKQKALTFK